MANSKTGLSYYNIDTDRYQDIRIKRLKKDFGCIGIAVYDYILCEIYRVRGCFIEWDESTAFDVAEYFSLNERQINEVVNYCCAVGLFNKELFASGSIITSESIQKRYIEMSTRAKRKDIFIPEKCKIIREESPIIREESQKTTEFCDKVKKSKVKKSKDSDIGSSIVSEEKTHAGACYHPQKNIQISLENLENRKSNFMAACAEFVQTYEKQMIREFFDYWTEPNRSKTKMRFEMEKTWNLDRRLRTWEKNEQNFKNGTNQKNCGTVRNRPTSDELSAAIEIGIALAEAEKNG